MELKRTIDVKDHFPKYKMKGEGESARIDDSKYWRTIFNNDIACLKL